MEDFNPSTRATSNNARGNKRRIGSSKRSSFDPDKADEPIAKKTKVPALSAEDATSSCLPTLPGASVFFQNQKLGSKGMRVKVQTALCSGDIMQVAEEDYRIFFDRIKLNDPNRDFLTEALKQIDKKSSTYSWLLLSESNLLFFGLGSKRRLVKNIVESMLAGEDVIEIDGTGNNSGSSSQSEKYVKALMGHINRTILKNKNGLDSCSINLVQQAEILADLLNIHYGQGNTARLMQTSESDSSQHARASDNNVNNPKPDEPQSSSTGSLGAVGGRRPSRQGVQDHERWGGRYSLAKSKLYIVVHNICGDALSSPISQHCLSLLASCKSVSILATVENLNSVAYWDRTVLARYRWAYQHVPTFENARIPHDGFPLISYEMNSMGQDEEQDEQPAAEADAEGEGEGEEFTPVVEGDEVEVVQAVPVGASPSASVRTGKTKTTPSQGKKAAAINKTAESKGKYTATSTSASTSTSTPTVPTKAKAARAGGPLSSTNGSTSGSYAAVSVAAVAPAAKRAAQSLQAITKSVTPTHMTIFEALVKAVQQKADRLAASRQAESATAAAGGTRGKTGASASASAAAVGFKVSALHESGVPINELFKTLRGTLVVRDLAMLKNLLKEFADHGVVGTTYHQNEEYLYFRHPYADHLRNNLVQKVMSVMGK